MIISTNWISVSRRPEQSMCMVSCTFFCFKSCLYSHYNTIMLNGHTGQYVCPYLAKYNQLQQLLHILLPNMCQKQMCLSNDQYANCFMYTYMTAVSVSLPYKNSLQLIMWPNLLVYLHFIFLVYVSEQICLSHHICMFHCTNTVVYMYTPHYCTYMSNNKL